MVVSKKELNSVKVVVANLLAEKNWSELTKLLATNQANVMLLDLYYRARAQSLTYPELMPVFVELIKKPNSLPLTLNVLAVYALHVDISEAFPWLTPFLNSSNIHSKINASFAIRNAAETGVNVEEFLEVLKEKLSDSDYERIGKIGVSEIAAQALAFAVLNEKTKQKTTLLLTKAQNSSNKREKRFATYALTYAYVTSGNTVKLNELYSSCNSELKIAVIEAIQNRIEVNPNWYPIQKTHELEIKHLQQYAPIALPLLYSALKDGKTVSKTAQKALDSFNKKAKYDKNYSNALKTETNKLTIKK